MWGVRFAIFGATCLGVFVLPFLLPAPYFQGVSASNLAGFNNRIATVAAACLATLVFFLCVRWPEILGAGGDLPAIDQDAASEKDQGLPWSVVFAVAGLCGMVVFLAGLLILRSGLRYGMDWGYFIHQASMHADFGRYLYTQIEFSYGPILFYGPVAAQELLRPLHLSLAGGYLVALTVEILAGTLMVGYVINHLPMSRRWKIAIFLLLTLEMVPSNMGLNYTFFRFVPPLAFVVMASQRERAWAAAIWIVAGQAVCLGISPGIGFGFFVSSFAYALYRCFTQGPAWALGVAAPIVSTGAFLLLVGRPYLRMLGMYAHGVMNFPVEPTPFVLLFLFALVWLVPGGLARFFRERRPEAPMLAALYLVSLALLPAAFGRADPWHVFWNGLSVFLLSVVAVSSMRRWKQMAWGACLTAMFLWLSTSGVRGVRPEMGPVLHSNIAALRGRPYRAPGTNKGFRLRNLQRIVGHDPVVATGRGALISGSDASKCGAIHPDLLFFSACNPGYSR